MSNKNIPQENVGQYIYKMVMFAGQILRCTLLFIYQNYNVHYSVATQLRGVRKLMTIRMGVAIDVNAQVSFLFLIFHI